MLLCSLFAKAQTIEVQGIQSGVWNADTVFVTGNVTVEDSLLILQGTTVIFQDFYSITAKSGASIQALGAENDSILFTVTDTTGFQVFNSGRGGWNGIRLEKAGATRFDYCRFQYGKAALDDDQDGGAFRIFNCDDVEIGNSTLFCNFSREHGGALNAEHSSVVMHDCDVTHNQTYTGLDTVYFMYGGGLRFINCEVELTDMNFRYNDGHSAIGGALSLDSCTVNIDRCVFEYNYGINGGGLYLIRSYDNPCRIANSLFANNTSGHFGGGLAISDSSPEVSNLTVTGNMSEGVNCAGIFFYQYSSPVVRNCIVYGNVCDWKAEDDVQIWIWTYDNDVPEFYNCLVENGLEGITGHDKIRVYENCLEDDPLFSDPENDNYHIGEGSPALDSGLTYDSDFSSFDLDRNVRVCNGTIDMGAYEYSTTGLEDAPQNTPLANIIGNPITPASYAEINLEEACTLFASVFSMDGKLLVSKELGHTQQGLNRFPIGDMFDTLPEGTYLVTFKTGKQYWIAKVIK